MDARDLIYQVEFVNDPESFHEACCTVNYEGQMRNFDAHVYWANPPQYGLVEVIAEADLRTIK